MTFIPQESEGKEVGKMLTLEDLPHYLKQNRLLINIQDMHTLISEKSHNIISSFSAGGIFTYISPTVTALHKKGDFMKVTISTIHKEDAWELRHRVMWPDKHFDFIKLRNDDLGIHYGLFKDNILISVVSLFVSKDEAQFRKFATLPEEQGKGYGSALLHFVLEEASNLGIKKIWCNARINKSDYYQKFGMQETGENFKKENKVYVIMEREI